MLYVGKIIDEKGQPLEGAEVSIKGYTGTSNDKGFWHITAPKFNQNTCFVDVRHKDYVLSSHLYRQVKSDNGVIRMGG
jgi:phage replication-related protein YjqB (UPF0714/DUF867 family)